MKIKHYKEICKLVVIYYIVYHLIKILMWEFPCRNICSEHSWVELYFSKLRAIVSFFDYNSEEWNYWPICCYLRQLQPHFLGGLLLFFAASLPHSTVSSAKWNLKKAMRFPDLTRCLQYSLGKEICRSPFHLWNGNHRLDSGFLWELNKSNVKLLCNLSLFLLFPSLLPFHLLSFPSSLT